MKDAHGIIFSILVLALVAAVSGCIGQSQQNVFGQNGLHAKDFYTDPSESNIESGDIMDVTLVVENVGGTTAQNVQAELLGADWVPGRLYAQSWMYDDNGDGVFGITMSPPNPQLGTPGELRTATWRLPTPYVPEGLRKNYNLKSRITYDYSTKAAATLKAYSKRWYDMQLQQGKLTPAATSQILVTHSIDPTPIAVSISGPDKIVVPERNYQAYTYQITFTNVGGGTPITNSVEGLVYGSIRMDGPAYFVDCMGVGPQLFNQPYWQTSAGYSIIDNMVSQYASYYPGYTQEQLRSLYISRPFIIDFSQLQTYAVLKLRRGETVTKSCTIAVPNPDAFGNYWGMEPYRTEGSMTIYFDLNYRYYIDADTAITVTGPISGLPNPNTYPGTGDGTGLTEVECNAKCNGCTCVDTSSDASTGKNSCQLGTGQEWCDQAAGLKCCVPASTQQVSVIDSDKKTPEQIGTSVTANTCAYECKDSLGHGDVNGDGIPDAYSSSQCASSCTGSYYPDSGGNAWCASQSQSKGKCCCDSTTRINYICLYRSGAEYPFGCWLPSIVDQKLQLYQQQSGCAITKGGYRPRGTEQLAPYVGECA